MANNTALVKVMADNTQLTKELAEATRKLKGFERAANRAGKKKVFQPMAQSAQNVGGPLSKVVGGLGMAEGALQSIKNPAALAAAGFAAVALAAKGLEDAVNVTRSIARETGKLQRETGLSAEAASGYLAIVDRFGISGSKLSTQLGFLSKRMRTATGDSKGATTALEQFAAAGVRESTIRSGDLNAVLLEAADRFAAMEDGPQKTALAMQLFGRSGKDLLPVLNQGGAGIEELQAKMKALGLTVGEDTVKQNKALGRATKDLSQVMRGLSNTVGVAVLPRITRLVTAFSEAIVKFRTGKKPTTDLDRVIHNLGSTIRWVSRNWSVIKGVLSRTFGQLFPQLTAIVKSASTIIKTDWGGMARSVKSRTVGIKNSVVSGFNSIVGFVKNIPNRLGNLAGRFAASGKRLGKAFIDNIGSGLSRTGRFLSDLGNSVRRWINNNTVFGDKIKLGPIEVRVPALAAGGIVNRPTLALIGEAGPEAVVPLSGRNARRAGVTTLATGGGGNNYFTINTTGTVDEQALAARIGWTLATRGLA